MAGRQDFQEKNLRKEGQQVVEIVALRKRNTELFKKLKQQENGNSQASNKIEDLEYENTEQVVKIKSLEEEIKTFHKYMDELDAQYQGISVKLQKSQTLHTLQSHSVSTIHSNPGIPHSGG